MLQTLEKLYKNRRKLVKIIQNSMVTTTMQIRIMKTFTFDWSWINGKQVHQEYSNTDADSTTDKDTDMIS
jgi:3-methyladenine DNA glycosylase Tag